MTVLFSFGMFVACEGKKQTNDNKVNNGGDGKMEYEQITQKEAKRLMDTEKDYIILDVRTQAEYDEGHIKGAICVPNESIKDEEPRELKDKDQLILIYCRSGNRSKQAAGKLVAMGYTNIKEFGGINTWEYETVGDA